MSKPLQIIIGIVVLLIGFSVFYYFVIFMPQKEETRLEQEKQELLIKEEEKQEVQRRILNNKILLETCLAHVEVQAKEKADTLMSAVVGTQTSMEQLQRLMDDISEWGRNEKDLYFKRYPQE